jgi:hypothetical protein
LGVFAAFCTFLTSFDSIDVAAFETAFRICFPLFFLLQRTRSSSRQQRMPPLRIELRVWGLMW